MYNKTAIAQEISGPEIANVMLGQPESYSNARFTTLNYKFTLFRDVDNVPTSES